ncbi:MAG: hypothetical protein P8X73_07565 [Ignavibacteriaceae bacterium]
MRKTLPIFLLLIIPSIYSQSSDSLKVDTVSVIARYDTLLVDDSTRVMNKSTTVDSLVPIQNHPLTDLSRTINKRVFYFYNYWYTGDFLRTFSLNFIKDLAFLGQPNVSFIYGAGFGGISFMEDGVLWNNRYTNSLDLNQVQSEDVDSIEIIPSPRGFLYGPNNNPVSVNFIMKDFISTEPYSRIKYYEGPYGEAMIDGIFSAQIYEKWKLSFGVTNRSADDRYVNSAYSSWLVNAKLKYYLSNSINITALYSYVDTDVGLNGGVDVDSISKVTNDINTILYNSIIAPVVYPARINSVLNHNFGLRVQTLPFDDARAELSIYYKSNSNELMNDMDTLIVKNTDENKTYGVSLNYNHHIGDMSFQVLGTYEDNNTIENNKVEEVYNRTYDYNYLSVSAIFSLNLLNNFLIPSIFYNYSIKDISDNNSSSSFKKSGLGIDLQINFPKNFTFYFGYSGYEQANTQTTSTIEFGGRYNNNNLKIDLKIFSRNDFVPYYLFQPYNLTPTVLISESDDIKGLGLIFNYSVWKLLLETNTSHYFDIEGYNFYMLPDLQFTCGFFVNDMFFDNNLYLKAGFIYYYTGNINALAAKSGVVDVEPSNKLDLSVAGEIRKVAIVYFAWENLFNNEYFITPYYPMPERTIRFGVSWELFD